MGFKDYLENLELGDDKFKLSKEEIKAIIAESGKTVNAEVEKAESKYKQELESYKATIDDLNDKIKNAPSSAEMESLKKTIADMEAEKQKRIDEEKAKRDDEILTNNIIEAFGDKQFVNDYTKNAIINDIKAGLKDANNGGKSAKDLFEELTKDKSDIFANPNKLPDMAGMGDSETDTNIKEIPVVW